MYQTTLRHEVACSGIGLHSGREVRLSLRPAPADAGVVFHIHVDGGVRQVFPSPEAVMATELATTLGTADRVTVSTVEHLLAAVRGMGVDNLAIHVEGGEVPILDGSAAVFVQLFARAGIRQLSAPRRVLRVVRPFEFAEGDKRIRVTPYSGFRVDCTSDFPHPAIGRQRLVMDVTPAAFGRVASARTFGFLRDVEYLRSRGLALGGSLDNAVVLDEHGVINPEGLRVPDEFVRHKVLDFIGDMAMLRLPLRGSFELVRSGHQFNNAFLRELEANHLLREAEEWAEVEAERPAARRQGRRSPFRQGYAAPLSALA